MTAILLMAWAACMFVILAVFPWRNLNSRRAIWRVIVVWCLTGTTIAASLAAIFALLAMYVDATYSAMRDGGEDITLLCRNHIDSSREMV